MENMLRGLFSQPNYQRYPQTYSNNDRNFDGIPDDEVYNDYQQLAQQVPSDQLYDMHQQSYQQMPQQQRQGLLDGLMGAFRQEGVNPQQVGVHPNDPSPDNLARASQYTAGQPDLLQKIMGPNGLLSNPLAKAALGGALAWGASRFFGGNNQQQGQGGGLFGGIGSLLGGNPQQPQQQNEQPVNPPQPQPQDDSTRFQF